LEFNKMCTEIAVNCLLVIILKNDKNETENSNILCEINDGDGDYKQLETTRFKKKHKTNNEWSWFLLLNNLKSENDNSKILTW
jgi:hypothetical protein